jgi:hypothetical protein
LTVGCERHDFVLPLEWQGLEEVPEFIHQVAAYEKTRLQREVVVET